MASGKLFDNRNAENTLYALWIGTNDLGYGAFLSDAQAAGATLSTFVESIWTIFDRIYETGGRHLVLFNQAPLELSPLYAPVDRGGYGDSTFWTNKTSYNTTQYSYKMLQYTTSVNALFDYGVPFQLFVERRWPGATVAIYDVHRLLREIDAEPERYLTAPANVTGVYHYVTRRLGSVLTRRTRDRASCGSMSCIIRKGRVSLIRCSFRVLGMC